MMRSILSKVVNEDLTDRLPLIKAPTLLVWGEEDKATPLADALKMNRLIPVSYTHLILSVLETPLEISSRVSFTFMRRSEPRRCGF